MTPQAERRKHTRVAAEQPVDYAIGRHRGKGRLADVSLGGIGLIAAPHPMLRKGVQARVRFQVGAERFETDVVVCRMLGEERLGAFFVKLNDQQRAALEKLVAQQPPP